VLSHFWSGEKIESSLLLFLEIAKTTAYTERIKNDTNTEETVTKILMRTLLFWRPTALFASMLLWLNRRMQ
jgi:hypothetical protein